MGNTQREDVDFTETFSPIAKMVTFRTLLSIASARNWEVHQMHIHNAFLYRDLLEEVLMKLPLAFMGLILGKFVA